MKLLRVNDIIEYMSAAGYWCKARVLKVYGDEFLADTYEMNDREMTPSEQNWHSFKNWRRNSFRIITAAPHKVVEAMKEIVNE